MPQDTSKQAWDSCGVYERETVVYILLKMYDVYSIPMSHPGHVEGAQVFSC